MRFLGLCRVGAFSRRRVFKSWSFKTLGLDGFGFWAFVKGLVNSVCVVLHGCETSSSSTQKPKRHPHEQWHRARFRPYRDPPTIVAARIATHRALAATVGLRPHRAPQTVSRPVRSAPPRRSPHQVPPYTPSVPHQSAPPHTPVSRLSAVRPIPTYCWTAVYRPYRGPTQSGAAAQSGRPHPAPQPVSRPSPGPAPPLDAQVSKRSSRRAAAR